MRYERWEGDLEGVAEDPKRCVMPQRDKKMPFMRQCGYRRLKDKDFCRRHDGMVMVVEDRQ